MKHPEHDKLSAVHEESLAIGRFMEWLLEKKAVELMQRYSREEDAAGDPVYRNSKGEVVEDWPPLDSGGLFSENRALRVKRAYEEGIEQRLVLDPRGEKLVPSVLRTDKLLAEFFEIDLNKLEAEKRAMLEECRRTNAKR